MINALLILEGKISGVKARGRPRRAWTDDLQEWTKLSRLQRAEKNCRGQDNLESPHSSTFYLRRGHQKKKKKKKMMMMMLL